MTTPPSHVRNVPSRADLVWAVAHVGLVRRLDIRSLGHGPGRARRRPHDRHECTQFGCSPTTRRPPSGKGVIRRLRFGYMKLARLRARRSLVPLLVGLIALFGAGGVVCAIAVHGTDEPCTGCAPASHHSGAGIAGVCELAASLLAVAASVGLVGAIRRRRAAGAPCRAAGSGRLRAARLPVRSPSPPPRLAVATVRLRC